MCIGPEDGCQVVPDPIAPIDMTFVSLEPTRMPMSSPDITKSGPIFIEPFPGIPSMLFIPLIAPGEGLAPGIGMFISICFGDADGDGVGMGMFMPGIDSIGDGDGEGAGEGAGFFDSFSRPGVWPWCCPGVTRAEKMRKIATAAVATGNLKCVESEVTGAAA